MTHTNQDRLCADRKEREMMTVSELIEELQKYPPHHRVFVNHDTTPPFSPEPSSDWAEIHDVRVGEACTVIVDAEPNRW